MIHPFSDYNCQWRNIYGGIIKVTEFVIVSAAEEIHMSTEEWN